MLEISSKLKEADGPPSALEGEKEGKDWAFRVSISSLDGCSR